MYVNVTLLYLRNLLLTEKNVVKICDMGVSTISMVHTLTAKKLEGTWKYMSPEQAESCNPSMHLLKYSYNTDVWFDFFSQ